MPLLVPVLIALGIVLAAVMLWVWATSIARVQHGGRVASGAGAAAALAIGLMVSDASLEWVGWALLAVGAVALVAGWVWLARWGSPAAR
ncbi:hypothetical protein [Agrococcus sp. Marseille-P2731]|uniref:hypothetical protein n=1 Tax=Agrococcus sp. Marseille-P2731 TaxID=1841862 RepID=UPI000931E030|nr:hypothetical protein [Agrococcus sp. Marseille-P2731]